MKNNASVTDGKPIAVWSQSILGVNADNLLDTFYNIHEKGEVLFFSSVPNTTQHLQII
jgi:hypothetical protein